MISIENKTKYKCTRVKSLLIMIRFGRHLKIDIYFNPINNKYLNIIEIEKSIFR